MKKKLSIRVLCALMSLALLFGTIPTLSVASAETIIDEVSLEIMAPAAGRYPSYLPRTNTTGTVFDVEDDTYGECQENGVIWFCDDLPISPDAPFEIGKKYTVRFELLCEEGYNFRTGLVPPEITVNGAEGVYQFGTATYLSAEYTFQPLSGYTISFDANGGGGTMEPRENVAGDVQLPVCTFTAPTNKQFKAWQVDSVEYQPGEKAPVYADITIKALWESVSGKQQIFNVVATSEDMDTIPTLYGRTLIPEYTIIEGAPAFLNASTGNFSWEKKVGEKWENQYVSRFTPGEWRASVAVRIDRDGAVTHELGNPTTLTVNGKQWTPENGTGMPYVYDTYSHLFFYSPVYVIEGDPNIQPPVSVESVTLRMEGYASGLPVANAKVLGSERVVVSNKTFIEIIDNNNDGMPDDAVEATGNFSPEKPYAVAVELEAASGYDISQLSSFVVSLEGSISEQYAIYDKETDTFNCMYILQPPKGFNITFAAAGGIGIMMNEEDVSGDYVLPLCGFAPPAGKLFKAWNVGGVEKVPGEKITVSAHTTITAVWDDIYNMIPSQKPVSSQKCAHLYQAVISAATFKSNGKTVEKCIMCGNTRNKKTVYKIKTVKLETSSYTYNGKSKKPDLKILDSKGKKIEASNYTVSYAKGRKAVGKYKVTVKFKGKYSGTKKLYFKINPPKTSVSKVTAGKKSLKIKLKKQSKQTSGYQIAYSTSKKFTKSTTKTLTVKGNKNTAKTIKKLKAKKTYYVRVRTYKTVSKTKYYSAWSKSKSKKTK